MRTSFRLLIVLASVVAGAGLLYQITTHFLSMSSADAQAPVSTAVLYSASFPDAQGRMQPLNQWQNQVAIVNFWASWCPPCRDEMPELSALQNKYRGRGLVVLGISTDDATTMQVSASKSPQRYLLLAAGYEGAHLASVLGNDKGVLPYTLLLRRDGSIVATYFGRLDMNTLEQDLLPLLR
jgi:thiol-disulfide isomerase/thioredoxin